MNWQVISFYTEGTGYEQEISKLERSLVKFDLPYKLYSYRPLGTWRKNLNYKSETILKAFEEFPGKDIVFLDADAVVQQYPKLFDELSEKREHDIAVHFFNYSFALDELLSGTIWVNSNNRGRLLIERWHEIGLEQINTRHQLCLKIAITKFQQEGNPMRVYRLPFSYTCIFDTPHRRNMNPVIEHFQASRRFRRQVGYGTDLLRLNKPKISTSQRRRLSLRKNLQLEDIQIIRK